MRAMSETNVVETINDPLLYTTPLPYVGRYYPYGFPVDIATNSRAVLEAAQESWALYTARFDKPPLRVHVIVSEDGAGLPPDPVFLAQRHLLTINSDQQNFGVCDRLQSFAYCFVTRATVSDRVFFRWNFLDALVTTLQELTYYVAMHAACVALDGAGVLLFGQSGMGKSTLSYACARRGWTYVSDDAACLLWDGGRTVIGEPHRFRFRAEAPEIFPELRGLTVGRQLERKPTIEVRTAGLPIRTAPDAHIERVLFLDRVPGSRARLRQIDKQTALERLSSQTPVLDPDLQPQRTRTIEVLLEAPVFELRYGSFEDAVSLLERLVRE
jgi:hypothetical protein